MTEVRYLEEAVVAAEADECLDFVQAGGEIVIIRDGWPVARMTPLSAPDLPQP